MSALQDQLRKYIGRRQHAYRRTFDGPLAEEVLIDLARFCRAHETTFHPDARTSALLEGRREVLLRIMDHCKLSPDDLFDLSTGALSRGSALRVSTATTEEDSNA